MENCRNGKKKDVNQTVTEHATTLQENYIRVSGKSGTGHQTRCYALKTATISVQNSKYKLVCISWQTTHNSVKLEGSKKVKGIADQQHLVQTTRTHRRPKRISNGTCGQNVALKRNLLEKLKENMIKTTL